MPTDKNINKYNKRVKNSFNSNTNDKGLNVAAGTYLGVVVNDEDTTGLGRVKVQVSGKYGSFPAADLGPSADPELYLGAVWVMRMLPYGGLTGEDSSGGANSYGIVSSPPSVGNNVVVAIFPDLSSGVLLGVLPNMNQMKNSAGVVATETKDGTFTQATEVSKTRTSTTEKPAKHPMAFQLAVQGIEQDRIRGLGYSSPTREAASKVTGVVTPGGHALTMDDGSTEDGDQKSLRIRSSGGAQILMDDTNGFTYIVNRDGTSWVEMNRNGDVDVYSKNGIHMHTEGDYNIQVGGAFNVQANTINLVGTGSGGIALSASGGDVNVYALTNLNLQADANGNLRVAGNYRETAARIDMNGPPALAASQPLTKSIAGNKTVTNSIVGRVPEAEPWAGHLDVSMVSKKSGGAPDRSKRSYYDGTRTPTGTTDGQDGDFNLNDFPISADTDLLKWKIPMDPWQKQVDPDLIKIVSEVARRFGQPLTMTSGYRPTVVNDAVGGVTGSQHLTGKAVDISGSEFSNQDRINLVSIASSLGIIGIGVYKSGSLHFDNRSSGVRAGWGWDNTRNTVPSYMVTTLNKHRAGGFSKDGSSSGSNIAADRNKPANIVGRAELENDPAFQSQLALMKTKYPGLTDQMIYDVIQKESGFDTTSTNKKGSGATGLFQFMPGTAKDLGYTTAQIQNMTASQQLAVYDKYLASANYQGGDPLGIIQAAPQAYKNLIIKYGSSDAVPDNTIIYRAGSAEARDNVPWQTNTGDVTWGSLLQWLR